MWTVAEIIAHGGLNVATGFIGREGFPVGELMTALSRYLGGAKIAPGAALGVMRQAALANAAARRVPVVPGTTIGEPPRENVPSAPPMPGIGGAATYQYKWVVIVPTEIGEVRVPVVWESNRRLTRRQIIDFLRSYVREIGDPDASGVRTARFQPTGRYRYVPIYEVTIDR